MPLSETSPMPFGQHRNKPMQDVPASYLHYLWTNGLKSNAVSHDQQNVRDYILENLSALQQEHSDGIW